jgi:hypothetical protein
MTLQIADIIDVTDFSLHCRYPTLGEIKDNDETSPYSEAASWVGAIGMPSAMKNKRNRLNSPVRLVHGK